MGAKRLARLTGVLAVVSLAATSCGDPAPADAVNGARQSVVRIAVNPWLGYKANVAVMSYLLEEKLNYRVEEKKLPEAQAWAGFETGSIDVIAENWGHEELKAQYIDQKKVAVEGGPTGNNGVIGWYVPKWMMETYPELVTWHGLNRHAELFKTQDSAGRGQLLAGDPAFVTHDQALIRSLGLNFTVVYSGSEEASIKIAREAAKQRKPLLFYFYEPQWLHAEAEFARVALPPWREGCDRVPAQVACDYPQYILEKIVSRKFALKGGDAYELIENFSWSNKDQNEVANYIANDGMSPRQAAERWASEHPRVWEAWLPANG